MHKIFLSLVAVTVLGVATLVWQSHEHKELLAKLALLSGNLPAAAEKPATTESPPPTPSDFASILAIPDRMERMRALLDYAGELKAEDLHVLVQKLGLRTMDEDNQMTLSVLLARLVQLDPAGTLAWAKKISNTEGRGPILESLFNSWASTDPAAALAALNQIDDVVLRQRLLETTLANMTNNDPQKALAFFLDLPTNQQDVRLISPIFRNWAARDPLAAATAALSLPAAANRFVALDNALQGWAQRDPEAALNWAASLPLGSVRNGALAYAVANLAQQNPQAAINFVTNLPRAADRNDLAIALAAAWGQNDPDAALAWVEDFPSTPAHDAAIQDMLALMSRTNPQLASTKLDLISDPAVRNKAMSAIAINWGQLDTPGALTWVSSLPAPNQANNPVVLAARQLIYVWTLSDPAAASGFVTSEMNGVAYYNNAVGAMFTTWASADHASAMAWVDSLPDGNLKTTLIAGNAIEMANNSGWQDALNLPAGGPRTNAINLLIQRWPASDAAAAAPVFYDTLADRPALQATAIGNAVSAWLVQDELAASQWVSSLPPGTARDAGASQIITLALKTDPATAFNWAASISAAAQRNTQISRVVTQWARTDPTAATNAVQTANVNANQRAALLQTIQRLARPAQP